MDLSYLFICLRLGLVLFEMNSAFVLNDSRNTIKARAGAGINTTTEASTVKCELQGTARLPAFSVDGDYIVGGVFSIHHYMHIVKNSYTTMPELLMCSGRLVRMGGFLKKEIGDFLTENIGQLFSIQIC